MCLTLFFAKGSRCLGRNDKWPISTLTCKHEGSDYCLLPSTSWICLWGLMTTTLGLDLEPGISQCLGKVVIHWTSDGYRVGHRLCFFVVFSKAATEVLLNHRIADCVRYNDIMSEGRRKNKPWLLTHMQCIKITLLSLHQQVNTNDLVSEKKKSPQQNTL